MAATAEARRLTEAHRRAQLQVGTRTVLQMRAVWTTLDPDNLDGTFDRWLASAQPIVATQRAASARAASGYVSTFKVLELGPSARPPVVQLADVVDAKALTTSLLVTGPISVKKAMTRGVPIARALDTAMARSAAAAMRHVLDGGRGTVMDTIAGDRQSLGWARATGGSTCAFCAMLASRGPVYREESADFEAHDHCSCSAEPVYRDDAAWPSGSERYADIWRDAKEEEGETLPNFRRLLATA